MSKSPAMEKFCEHMVQSMFGRSRQGNVCVSCGSDKIKPEDFTDKLSLKEFGISRLCQKCQNSVFVEEDEMDLAPNGFDDGQGYPTDGE